MVYDALFAWLRHAAEERHNWPAKGGMSMMHDAPSACPVQLSAKPSWSG